MRTNVLTSICVMSVLMLLFTTNAFSKGKELYIPKKVWCIDPDNDYNNPTSRFSYKNMVQSDNIAVLWDVAFGDTPHKNENTDERFDVNETLKEGERFYEIFENKFKFLGNGKSLADQYKMLLYVFKDENKTAYGDGAENKVGVMWFRPARMAKYPYCTVAHELSHSFQFMVRADGAWGFSSASKGSKGHTIGEMTSQWMLWQVYPTWNTIENYHLTSYMKKTHYAFLHETNCYHSPYVLEYWSDKHGLDIIGRIWRESIKGEDVVTAYKRITKINQDQFNSEMYDAATKFITWDMRRIEKVSREYANTHSCKMDAAENGWYIVAKDRCPQNYGYNGIKLNVPQGGSVVKLNFKGLIGVDGFRDINSSKAGWRYGFLAVRQNGKRVYGDMNSASESETSFTVPKDTQYLWLVVMGAPKEHWEHLWDDKDDNDEQWPYKIKLSGTTLHNSVLSNVK